MLDSLINKADLILTQRKTGIQLQTLLSLRDRIVHKIWR